VLALLALDGTPEAEVLELTDSLSLVVAVCLRLVCFPSLSWTFGFDALALSLVEVRLCCEGGICVWLFCRINAAPIPASISASDEEVVVVKCVPWEVKVC
jgi:hypothetical protein